MTRKTLPRKLSDGILLALEDLKKAERSPRYSVEMGRWHGPLGGACQVCLAGSVMAFSLGAKPTKVVAPWDYGQGVTNKLRALNFVRVGEVSSAVYLWDAAAYARNKDAVDKLDGPVTGYRADRAKWKRAMRRIAKQLAEIGL